MRKTFLMASALGVMAFYAVACSKVEFSSNGSSDPGVASPSSCTQTAVGCPYDYLVNVSGAKVDILFVNDNSASMSFEQKALASRFAGFIQLLDSKTIDYRIAMTTTDISASANNEARAINGNGSLQDGKLITFGNGQSYLTPSVADRINLFNSAIVRPETAQCEQFIANYVAQNGINGTSTQSYVDQYKANCPSGDERGTYAANLVVKNNPGGFMRDNAYFVIIFVADEDVRSGLYCGGANNAGCSALGFELEDGDQPATLINSLKARSKDMVSEIHAVVVKDNACLAQQNSQALGSPAVAATNGFVRGSIGNLYLIFPQNGWGVSTSICMDNYTSALTTIANKIVENKPELLNCDNPTNLSITAVPADPNFAYVRNGRTVTYTNLPAANSQIHFSYSCH